MTSAPGRSAFGNSAEVAVARCKQRIGRLRIGIALESLFEGGDRLVELPQGNSRLSQKIEREVPARCRSC